MLTTQAAAATVAYLSQVSLDVWSLASLFFSLSLAVSFFLNVYLLQEHRHLVPAKDTEAKTRFRR